MNAADQPLNQEERNRQVLKMIRNNHCTRERLETMLVTVLASSDAPLEQIEEYLRIAKKTAKQK